MSFSTLAWREDTHTHTYIHIIHMDIQPPHRQGQKEQDQHQPRGPCRLKTPAVALSWTCSEKSWGSICTCTYVCVCVCAHQRYTCPPQELTAALGVDLQQLSMCGHGAAAYTAILPHPSPQTERSLIMSREHTHTHTHQHYGSRTHGYTCNDNIIPPGKVQLKMHNFSQIPQTMFKI